MLCCGLPVLGALLVGCGAEPADGGEEETVQLANPASQYCIELRGRLEIRTGEGGEFGMCHLPDGTIIEEWALFRRDHPQAEG